MAKKEDYDQFPSLASKLQYLVEVHGNKKTRHFSAYEVELINLTIDALTSGEKSNIGFTRLDGEIRVKSIEQEDKEKVIILLDQGVSNVVISQVIGVSKSKVSKWKKEHILLLFRKGISAKKVSSKYRINYSIALNWRRYALGITTFENNIISKKISNQTISKKQKNLRKLRKKKKRPRYSEKFQREAMRLIQEGKTGAEVSKILGVNRDTIRKWRKKYDMQGMQKMHPISLQNDVLDLIRSGNSNAEISRITGVSSTTVSNWKEMFLKEGF